MFADASPGPVKYALGKVKPDWPLHLRLPMTEAGEGARAAVDTAMEQASLLGG